MAASFITGERFNLFPNGALIYDAWLYYYRDVFYTVDEKVKYFDCVTYFSRTFDLKPESEQNEPRHDKTNNMSLRPVKTQISLGIRPV